MKDDTSEIINNATCYTLNNATSIYAYRNNVRSTYTQVGGKWYKTAETTYSSVPSSSYCLSYNDISDLNSNAAFEPIFLFIGFCLAIFVWKFVYFLWSRLVRYRI